MFFEFPKLYEYYISDNINKEQEEKLLWDAIGEIETFLYNYVNVELVKLDQYKEYTFDLDDLSIEKYKLKCVFYPFVDDEEQDTIELFIMFPSWSFSSRNDFYEFLKNKLEEYFK